MKSIKNNIKFIIVIVISVITSSITTLATNYLFNSNEVSYDNTISGIKQDNVQGAIDELYACTSNYAAYNTRLTNAETKIGTGSLTTTSNTLIGGINELNSNKINTSAIANNLTTTASGSVLDARQGKTLKDEKQDKIKVFEYSGLVVTTGYTVVNYPTGYTSSTHKYFIVPVYGGSTVTGWHPTMQIQSSRIVIYCRQGSALVPDDSKVSLLLFAIKV